MTDRTRSFGENHELSFVDRLGTWLSRRRLTKLMQGRERTVLADIGCGYDARFGTSVLERLDQLIAVDVSLSPDLLAEEKVIALTGSLPAVLSHIESGSVDVVVLNSVLEHLTDPANTLLALRRIARADGGILFVNVPSWLGKRALELSAFKFGLSPALEIEDHRRYYSARELWQALRDTGFLPSQITVRYHKLGLNVYALCRLDER
jgi:SAM-dependent methyltransferase